MKTIEELKLDKNAMELEVVKILQKFEETYGVDSITNMSISRHNGSNSAFGKIVGLRIFVDICNK